MKPRKFPRQARSRATFDAIVEACAQILRTTGWDGLTTNRVAERAGVSIGTLYEFFPDKESIVAVVAERLFARLLDEATSGLEVALGLDDRQSARFWIGRMVDVVASDRDLYRVLVREIPFVAELPAVRRANAALFELAREGSERARDRVNLPRREIDTWLISRMVANAVLEIAFAKDSEAGRRIKTDELGRLAVRMILGRDPDQRPRRR